MRNPVKKIEAFDSRELTFKCKPCELTFDSTPSRFEEELSRSHPFRYFSKCIECQSEVEQVAWQVGILCANANATGPRTAKGKAKSAKNLEGHPTPQECSVIRFNALKHGATAKTAILFPAKPGRYPHCKTCSVDHDYCKQQPACLKRTELFMKHFMAIQSDDPNMLKEIHGANQAGLSALFEDMMITVFTDGVTLRNPAYSFDKDGGFNLARYTNDDGDLITIEEIKAHPILKPLMELLSKNNLSLADLNMTPKVVMDQGITAGNLSDENQSKEQLSEFQKSSKDALEKMSEMIQRSQKNIKADPILMEYETEDEGQ
ncbi:MAG: hypothetical protein COA86_02875 [Kangiella sp.]|nr:MAG: hypothetical protein COA86_02875 [Kangiella sp.]